MEASAPLNLGELVLENVTDADNGAYNIGRIGLNELLHSDEDVVIEMIDFDLKGLVLPADAATDTYAGMLRYDSLDIKSIEVDANEQDLFMLENITSTASIGADETIHSTFNIKRFSVNLFAFDDEEDDEEFVDRLQELDYDELFGSVDITGTWQPTGGLVDLTKSTISIDDIGSLNLTFGLGGYTTVFAKSVAELTASLQSDEMDDAGQGMAFFGLMQQLSLHGASIRFDDDSFTGRMLNLIADREGVEPEQLVEQTKSTIQMQMAPFTGEAFANSTAQAVSDFLNNPSNLEVVAKPSAPVPFFMLGAAVMGAPQTLVTQLGLAVLANQ